MNWKIIRIIDVYVGIPLMYTVFFIRKLFHFSSSPRAVRRPGRILLVKFWGIGNLFMMLPSVSMLRRAYPDAEVDILTLESNRDAADCTRAFNVIHAVDTKGYIAFLRTTLSIMAELRRRDYDVVVDFEQFARFSALCVALMGKRITVGFNTASQRRHFLFSRPVVYDNALHTTLSYCALALAAGGDGDCSLNGWELSVPEAGGLNGKEILDRLGVTPEGSLVVFHVGTSRNFRERRWPAASYAALADLLIDQHGARVVLTGLAEEAFLAAEVARRVSFPDRVVDGSGQLGFDEYLHLIRLSDLVVSADTAAVHIASAAGIPVAGLYGPNTPVLYGPWGTNCIAFYKEPSCSPCITNFNAKTHDCRHPQGRGACMKMIEPAEVYEEIRKRYFGDHLSVKCEKSAGVSTCVP